MLLMEKKDKVRSSHPGVYSMQQNEPTLFLVILKKKKEKRSYPTGQRDIWTSQKDVAQYSYIVQLSTNNLVSKETTCLHFLPTAQLICCSFLNMWQIQHHFMFNIWYNHSHHRLMLPAEVNCTEQKAISVSESETVLIGMDRIRSAVEL